MFVKKLTFAAIALCFAFAGIAKERQFDSLANHERRPKLLQGEL